MLATDRARRMFALGPSDVGRPITDLQLSSYPLELQEHLDEVIQGRKPVEVKQVRWRRGTQERVLDVRITPLSVENGLLGTNITYSDLTERRLLERRLAETRRELADACDELWASTHQLELNLEQQRTILEWLALADAELVLTTKQLGRADDGLQSAHQELKLLKGELHRRTHEHVATEALVAAVLTAAASRELGHAQQMRP